MKIKYSKPMTKVILIKGEQHLLTESHAAKVKASISGYDEDTDGGFNQ